MKQLLMALYLLAGSCTAFAWGSTDKCDSFGIHGDGKRTACDFDSWIRYNYRNDNGSDSGHIEAAKKYFRHAIVAHDVYDDEVDIRLPKDIRRTDMEFDRQSGFFARVYERLSNDEVVEVMFAIRGTDELKDWPKGNLGSDQYLEVDEIWEKVKSQYEGKPILVVGHSLGGGIAAKLSSDKDKTSIIFNPSPKTKLKVLKQGKIVIISESYEVLWFLRYVYGNAYENAAERFSYHCIRSILPIGFIYENHSMFNLAHCLTRIASIEDFEAFSIRSETPDPGCRNIPATFSDDGDRICAR